MTDNEIVHTVNTALVRNLNLKLKPSYQQRVSGKIWDWTALILSISSFCLNRPLISNFPTGKNWQKSRNLEIFTTT